MVSYCGWGKAIESVRFVSVWFGLSITRIKAEIIASWQSKYKTSIRNQITMAASGLTAAREEEGLGLERGWGEGAFSTVWLPSITPPSWPVGVAVFNMQTNGQKNVYPHAHAHTHTWHTHMTHTCAHTLAWLCYTQSGSI